MVSHRLVNCISAHSWSPDQATLALSPNSSEILVYHASEHGNVKKHCVLKQHSQVVSSIDWNREGSFASCSHDSSAYVWSRNASAWTPELVFTRLRLAALCLRWSPNGDAFAIGSSEKRICICHRDKRNNCWVARLIRKCHSSSVTAVAWHPDGRLLASTSTDGRCMLFDACLPVLQDLGSIWDGAAAFTGSSAGASSSFGTVLLDIQAGSGWGLGLSWSPSGDQLAISSHGSVLQIASEFQQPTQEGSTAGFQLQQLLGLQELLPLRCVGYLSETKLVGAGFDGEVYLWEKRVGGEWMMAATLEPTAVLCEASNQPGQPSAAFRDKLALFKSNSLQGPSVRNEESADKREAGHSNAIVDMHIFIASNGQPTGNFSTAGWDGRVLLWQVDTDDRIKALH